MAGDEPFLRDAVAASLRFLGFEVTTAVTGLKVPHRPEAAHSTWPYRA